MQHEGAKARRGSPERNSLRDLLISNPSLLRPDLRAFAPSCCIDPFPSEKIRGGDSPAIHARSGLISAKWRECGPLAGEPTSRLLDRVRSMDVPFFERSMTDDSSPDPAEVAAARVGQVLVDKWRLERVIGTFCRSRSCRQKQCRQASERRLPQVSSETANPHCQSRPRFH